MAKNVKLTQQVKDLLLEVRNNPTEENVAQLSVLLEMNNEAGLLLITLIRDLRSKLDALKQMKRGEKGERGERGEMGEKPVAGVDFPLPKDGKDGKDGRDGIDGKDGINPSPEEVVPLVLEQLPDPEVTKTDKEELVAYIKRLEEELKKIRQAPLVSFGGRLGGGNSDSNVRFSLGRVIKKETPTGAINGSNTVYTVTQDIHAVISFVINGEAITDDSYSVSGKTITFTTPLPSELSGTSFRIVYA